MFFLRIGEIEHFASIGHCVYSLENYLLGSLHRFQMCISLYIFGLLLCFYEYSFMSVSQSFFLLMLNFLVEFFSSIILFFCFRICLLCAAFVSADHPSFFHFLFFPNMFGFHLCFLEDSWSFFLNDCFEFAVRQLVGLRLFCFLMCY